jgi:hypothetical protein
VLKHTLTLLQSAGSYLNICILISTYPSQVRVQLFVRLLGNSTTLELQFLVGVYYFAVRSIQNPRNNDEDFDSSTRASCIGPPIGVCSR